MNTKRVWAASLGILGLLPGGAGCNIGEEEKEDTCAVNGGALVASEDVARTIAQVTGEGPCNIHCAGGDIQQPCERYTISTTSPGTCTFTVEFTNGRSPEVLEMVFEEGPPERCREGVCRVGTGALQVPEEDAGG